MKYFLKVVAIIAICFIGLFALIIAGAKFSDANEAVRVKNAQKAIANKSIQVGMTTAEVIQAWGEPKGRQRSGGVGGTAEYWSYHGHAIKFSDGKLVSWTETK